MKTQAPKPRFEFITVSAPGEEIGGVLVDNLHAHEEHANPMIIVPFGWYGTGDLGRALNRAALAADPSPGSPVGSLVREAANRRQIAVSGTLANKWQRILNAISEWEALTDDLEAVRAMKTDFDLAASENERLAGAVLPSMKGGRHE